MMCLAVASAAGEEGAAPANPGAADTPLEHVEPPPAAPLPTMPPAPAPQEHSQPAAAGEAPSVVKSAIEATAGALGVKVPEGEDAAKKAAEEQAAEQFKIQRRQERLVQMADAREYMEIADRKLMDTLPYPLNIIMGVSLFGITIWRYIAALLLVILALIVLHYGSRRLARASLVVDAYAKEHEDEDPSQPRQPTSWLLAGSVFALALSNPFKLLVFSLLMRSVSFLIVTSHHPDILWFSDLLLFLGFVWYFFDLAGIADRAYGARIFPGSGRVFNTVRPMLLKIIRFLILLVAGMQIYHDFTGRTMVSVVAGLGIGGIALALASQETLRNLIGFASITMDRSFLVGDPVSIADYDGTVEHIGLRSMRLRTYDGKSVVIPNNTAINSNIVNLNRRPFIRREMLIALSTKNPIGKIEEAMELMRDVLDDHDGKIPGLPPVVRFQDFQPGRFVLQGLFWYDANKPFYLDECSKMNLGVARKFCEAGIIFASNLEG